MASLVQSQQRAYINRWGKIEPDSGAGKFYSLHLIALLSLTHALIYHIERYIIYLLMVDLILNGYGGVMEVLQLITYTAPMILFLGLAVTPTPITTLSCAMIEDDADVPSRADIERTDSNDSTSSDFSTGTFDLQSWDNNKARTRSVSL